MSEQKENFRTQAKLILDILDDRDTFASLADRLWFSREKFDYALYDLELELEERGDYVAGLQLEKISEIRSTLHNEVKNALPHISNMRALIEELLE